MTAFLGVLFSIQLININTIIHVIILRNLFLGKLIRPCSQTAPDNSVLITYLSG